MLQVEEALVDSVESRLEQLILLRHLLDLALELLLLDLEDLDLGQTLGAALGRVAAILEYASAPLQFVTTLGAQAVEQFVEVFDVEAYECVVRDAQLFFVCWLRHLIFVVAVLVLVLVVSTNCLAVRRKL